MDNAIVRGLCDKLYEKRKNAAHELESVIREHHKNKDEARIIAVVNQLVEIFNAPGNALHSRNGGLIGLAATGIALGVDMFQYADIFLEPLLSCFADPEPRIRYFACESMYNLCKCVKGEVLVYFNPIFDALSRLAADPDTSVQNGADMVNLMLRDIVAECAAVYVPKYEPSDALQRQYEEEYYNSGIVVGMDSALFAHDKQNGDVVPPLKRKAFSLLRFMPLLAERIQVLNSLTRSFLVQWITLLDSVPDLELVTYLPSILNGLLGYLSDPASDDVRVPTVNLLADFLREIRNIAELERGTSKSHRRKKSQPARARERDAEKVQDAQPPAAEISQESQLMEKVPEEDRGAYVPGQGVRVDYAAIAEILLQQLDPPHEEIIRQISLSWIASFLDFAEDVMLPFTPRLVTVILNNLADESKLIHNNSVAANNKLMACVQKLPTPPIVSSLPPLHGSSSSSVRNVPASPAPGQATQQLTRMISKSAIADSASESSPSSERPAAADRPVASGNLPLTKSRANTLQPGASAEPIGQDIVAPTSTTHSRPDSPSSALSVPAPMSQSLPSSERSAVALIDPFDYQATVSSLTVQFLSDHDETKIAALKWLMMLHQKAPGKILAMDDGTFPVLLKILSDPSETVVRFDLQLLAQISSSSEEGYFRSFMQNLLELFSTDRRLLDSRGGLIVRQLCVSLGAERIYRTFSEILEREEDLEFASVIVQKLNLILITTPEMADCRKRLKTADGQSFFIALYRSWCHNPVAVFALCLLAQAYEHASNLLLMFADLEITVHLLVQIDRLVQLIESPVFTYLRLQLLEPDKNPHLFKCLYGLLMTLPQSSAFVSLRNRLNAVSSIGFLQVAQLQRGTPSVPTQSPGPVPRSKVANKEEIKWQDLLNHFRNVQAKHEKARRQDSGGPSNGDGPYAPSGFSNSATVNGANGNPVRPQSRRKSTNETAGQGSGAGGPPRDVIPAARPTPLALALSPLNPRARGTPALPTLATINNSPSTSSRPMSPPLAQAKPKPGLSGRR